MSEQKKKAMEIMDALHQTIPHSYYCAVMDGLQDIETLQERDTELEKLWSEFGEVPMDPESECMEAPFMGWSAGVHREELWQWFDQRHSKGVAYLLYGVAADRTPDAAKLLYLKSLCPECTSGSCHFNHDGLCRFPLVYERRLRITEEDGCIDYDYCGEDA